MVIAEEVARYAVRLVDASRPGRPGAPDFIEKWVKWGAGLRASQALVRGAKARALMHGRYHVSIKDIQALAKPILRHRVMTNFYAESERITSDSIVERLLEAVPVPDERNVSDGPQRARTPVSRSGGRRAPRHARAQGPHHRRRISDRACTAARSRASASSSPSTASTCPATICRTIDWKVYARSDRHYVKKFEEETNLNCHVMLDVSGSMGYGSRGITKFEYGQCLAASLAYLMNRQRDGVRPHRVRRSHRQHAAGERAARASARDAAHARSADARPAHQRRQAAAPARRVDQQARHGRADLGSARRSGAGDPRPEAFPVPRHRRHRVSRARSATS